MSFNPAIATILAWVFLGEAITTKEGIGMFIAALGAILVQIKRNKSKVKKLK